MCVSGFESFSYPGTFDLCKQRGGELVFAEDTTHNNTESAEGQLTLTKQERRVIEILRKLDYGETRIVVKGHEIVQVEEKKSIKI